MATLPGEGHETVTCPGCKETVGGDEPFCPVCNADLWGLLDDEEDGPLDLEL